MKLKLTKAPDSVFFGYCSLPVGSRSLGDFVVFLAGYELKVWYKGPVA